MDFLLIFLKYIYLLILDLFFIELFYFYADRKFDTVFLNFFLIIFFF